MKLTRACLDDLRALVELVQEGGITLADQHTLYEFQRTFRDTYGIDWATALRQANTYAREWQRHR